MASVGQQLLDVPIDKMINSMAGAIADAQLKLDRTSIKVAQMMGGLNPDDRVQFGQNKLSLLELGLTPAFYQFTDTRIEVKIAISITRQRVNSGDSKDTFSGVGATITPNDRGVHYRYGAEAATVNAAYSNKYNHSTEGASLLRTTIVPVPAPSIFEERVRALIDEAADTNP